MASFVLYDKGTPSRTFKLDKAAMVIGRDEASNLSLPNVSVSRQHAKVVKTLTGWSIVDQKSANGTFVNGNRINEQILKSGDEVVVGKFRFIFVEDEVETLTQGGPDITSLPQYQNYSSAPAGGTINVSPGDMRKMVAALAVMEHGRIFSMENTTHQWKPVDRTLAIGSRGEIPALGLLARGRVAEITWSGTSHLVHRLAWWATIQVNSVKVVAQSALKPGDVLLVGRSRFKYEVQVPPKPKRAGAY